jgi:hypothetical protein
MAMHTIHDVRFNLGLDRPNAGCGREALAAPILCGVRRDLALESGQTMANNTGNNSLEQIQTPWQPTLISFPV